jgi:hypothetical protein
LSIRRRQTFQVILKICGSRDLAKRIGNLCLMRASDNSAAKSSAFGIKRPILEKSPYVLTKQISQAPDWTWEEIIARQKTLAAYAVKALPI